MITFWDLARAYVRTCGSEREEPPPQPQLEVPWLPVGRRGPPTHREQFEQRGPPPITLDVEVSQPDLAYLGARCGELFCVAVHEAGHSVVAAALNVQIESVETFDDCSGSCEHVDATDVRAKALICAAGFAAERVLFFADSDPEPPDEPDTHRLVKLLPDRNARWSVRQALWRFFSDPRAQAALDAVAAELLLNGRIDGAEVERVVEQSGARLAAGKLFT